MTIAKKIAKIRQQISAIQKDGTNPHYKSKYATLDSVYKALGTSIEDEGLTIIQMPTHNNEMYVLRTQLLDQDSDQMITFDTPMPVPENMQKLGSAITYARRYSLVSLFGMTQEDDDGNKASESYKKPSNRPKMLERVAELEKDLSVLDGKVAVALIEEYDAVDPAKLSDTKLEQYGKALKAMIELKGGE